MKKLLTFPRAYSYKSYQIHHFRRQDGGGAVPVLEVDDELADHHLLRRQLHHALQLAGVVVQDAYFLDVFVVVDFFHGGTSDMQR